MATVWKSDAYIKAYRVMHVFAKCSVTLRAVLILLASVKRCGYDQRAVLCDARVEDLKPIGQCSTCTESWCRTGRLRMQYFDGELQEYSFEDGMTKRSIIKRRDETESGGIVLSMTVCKGQSRSRPLHGAGTRWWSSDTSYRCLVVVICGLCDVLSSVEIGAVEIVPTFPTRLSSCRQR